MRSSQLTKMFVSLRFSLAHQDFLIEKTPVSLDLKQIFKIRFVKQGSTTNIHVYTHLAFPFSWPIIPQSQSCAHNTLEQQLSPSIKSPLLKLWHSYTHHWQQSPHGQATLPSSALMQVTQELVTTTQ